MKMEKIISIFEFFEITYFKKIILKNLNPFFKKVIKPEELEKIENILKNKKIGKSFPNLKEIKIAIIKLISRIYDDIEENTTIDMLHL